MLWRSVTRLGESGIVLPLILVVAIGLGWSTRRAERGLSLLLPIAFAAIIVTTTKIAFMGFGWRIVSLDFTGISGHAMLAAAVAPASPRREVATVLAAAIVVLVAVSRIATGAHSASEVLSRCALGVLAAAVTIRSIDRAGGMRLSLAWLAPALVWLVLTLPAPPVMASHSGLGRRRPVGTFHGLRSEEVTFCSATALDPTPDVRPPV